VYPRDIPRQANGVDCGVFALMFCNRMGLRGGAFDFRQEDISVNVRVAITHDLLEGKIQLSGKRS
jgi:Ulp1 family protease